MNYSIISYPVTLMHRHIIIICPCSYAFIYKHGQSASKQMKAHNPNDMYLELAVVSNFFSKADPAHICNAWQSL